MIWIKLLLRLYPRAWRERYEAEFVALLEARGPCLSDMLDILLGAWDARQFSRKQTLVEAGMNSPLKTPGRSRSWDVRILVTIAGVLAFLSFFLLIVALVGGMPERESEGTLFVTVVNLLGASAALQLAIRVYDRRLSNRMLTWSAGYVLAIVVVGALASFSANTFVAGSLAGLMISIGFGVWIALSAWGSVKARLLPVGLSAAGIIAGAGWMLLMLLTAYHNFVRPIPENPALTIVSHLVLYAFLLSGVAWMGGLMFEGARSLLRPPRAIAQA